MIRVSRNIRIAQASIPLLPDECFGIASAYNRPDFVIEGGTIKRETELNRKRGKQSVGQGRARKTAVHYGQASEARIAELRRRLLEREGAELPLCDEDESYLPQGARILPYSPKVYHASLSSGGSIDGSGSDIGDAVA